MLFPVTFSKYCGTANFQSTRGRIFRDTKLLYIARALFTLGSLSQQNYQLLHNFRHWHWKTLILFLYICLIFMSSLMLILEPQRQPERSYKVGFVCPSVLPSFRSFLCPGNFLELYHQFFLNFCMMLQTRMKLCVTAGLSGKTFQLKNLGKWIKWIKNGPETRFFEFIETFGHDSVMKTYINCNVPAKIPYFRKFLFLRYRPKCFQPISSQDFLINDVFGTN